MLVAPSLKEPPVSPVAIALELLPQWPVSMHVTTPAHNKAPRVRAAIRLETVTNVRTLKASDSPSLRANLAIGQMSGRAGQDHM